MNTRIIYIILVLALVGIVVLFLLGKGRKKKEVAKIRDQIKKGVGEGGGADIKNPLYNVPPAPGYTEAKTLADKIFNAKGSFWFMNDDENAVYEALSGKTKSQIVAIDMELQNLHGVKLDEFLKDWMNEEEYLKVYNIINSSK